MVDVREETDNREPRLAVQVFAALTASLFLILVILYLVGSFFANDWNPFDGAGEEINWSEVARISVPAAALVAASVAAVLGYHGQMTKVRELENDLDVALTRRFTEAVGQLGDDSLPIRLGGLYALERIAIDSPRDRVVVSEVLGAFVREGPDSTLAQDRLAAVLIASRSQRSRWGERIRFDFTRAKMDDLTLPASETLRKCVFFKASLKGAQVRGVDFTDSDFRDADLRDADFSNCNLTGCTFSASTRLEGAIFEGATLRETKDFPTARPTP